MPAVNIDNQKHWFVVVGIVLDDCGRFAQLTAVPEIAALIKFNKRNTVTPFVGDENRLGRRFLSGIIFLDMIDAGEPVRFVFDATNEQQKQRERAARSTIDGAGGITPHARKSKQTQRSEVKVNANRLPLLVRDK